MRRYLTVLILAVLAPAFLCKGQVIDFDTMKKYMTVNVSFSLEDRKDKTPISFASVYLIPDGDTTITHFALSDAQGNVKFCDVIAGKYQLNAEMIGYHPFRRNSISIGMMSIWVRSGWRSIMKSSMLRLSLQ